MLSLAAVDDEQSSIDLLCSYLSRFCRANQMEHTVKTFQSGGAFLWSYSPVYDVIFLDIELGGANGMDIARQIRKADENTIIIFVTQLAQYAVEGYQVDALDFMVKPLEYYSFELVMRKAVRRLRQRQPQTVVLQTEDGMTVLSSEQILYVEVLDHYITYHTPERQYTRKGMLADAEQQLDPHKFYRCSRCYLANLRYISAVGKDSISVGGQEISVSRGRRKGLLLAVPNYCGGGI